MKSDLEVSDNALPSCVEDLVVGNVAAVDAVFDVLCDGVVVAVPDYLQRQQLRRLVSLGVADGCRTRHDRACQSLTCAASMIMTIIIIISS